MNLFPTSNGPSTSTQLPPSSALRYSPAFLENALKRLDIYTQSLQQKQQKTSAHYLPGVQQLEASSPQQLQQLQQPSLQQNFSGITHESQSTISHLAANVRNIALGSNLPSNINVQYPSQQQVNNNMPYITPPSGSNSIIPNSQIISTTVPSQVQIQSTQNHNPQYQQSYPLVPQSTSSIISNPPVSASPPPPQQQQQQQLQQQQQQLQLQQLQQQQQQQQQHSVSPFLFPESLVLFQSIHEFAKAAKALTNIPRAMMNLHGLVDAAHKAHALSTESLPITNSPNQVGTPNTFTTASLEFANILIETASVPITVYAMACLEADVQVQLVACKLLKFVSSSTSPWSSSLEKQGFPGGGGGKLGQDEVANSEGIEACLQAIVNHPNDVEISLEALNVLRNVSWSDVGRIKMRAKSRSLFTQNRAKIDDTGFTLDVVTATMKKFASNIQIQDVGCSLLSNIAFGSSEAKQDVGEKGGLEIIILAMRKHPNDPGIQARGNFSIRNLCWNCPPNLILTKRLGGVKQVIDSLRNLSAIDVHIQGLAALGNLTLTCMANVIELINERGLEVILDSMKKFPDSAEVQENALTTVRNICTSDQANERGYALSFAENGGLDAVQATLSRYRTNTKILEKACFLLHLLATTETLRRATGEAGSVELLSELLKLHMQNSHLVHSIMIAFNGLMSGDDENKIIAGKAGFIDISIEAMKTHTSSRAIHETAIMVLDNIADGNESNCALEGDSGVITACLLSMTEFISSTILQEHACSLLIKIAVSAEIYTSKMIDEGAQRVVEATRKEHVGNPSIESLANQLSSLLMADSSNRTGRSAAGGTAATRLRSRSRLKEPGVGGRSSSRLGNRDRSPSPPRKEGRINRGFSVDSSSRDFKSQRRTKPSTSTLDIIQE